MTSGFSLDDVRKDTPGVENVLHFNNAGSALPPQFVLDTVKGHLEREAAIGGYEAAAEAHERLEAVYSSLATLIGAYAHQIAVVENATRAWDMAVYGYPFVRGDRVLISRAEYSSNAIALLHLRRRHGIELVVIEDDDHGQIDLDDLEAELARGAAMMSMTHAPTNCGLINPAEAVGGLCEQYGVFYVLDACQSAGQLPLDVGTIKCDVLSGTSRKYLRGPRGVGFLFVSTRALSRIEPPFLDLHAAEWIDDMTYEMRPDARRFENWESNVAGKLGLGAAVDYSLGLGIESTSKRLFSLADDLRGGLDSLRGVTVHDKGEVRGGIVTFAVDGIPSADVQAHLAAMGINTSTSPAGHARLDLPHRGLQSVVRASVHYYNSGDEVSRFVDAIDELGRSST